MKNKFSISFFSKCLQKKPAETDIKKKEQKQAKIISLYQANKPVTKQAKVVSIFPLIKSINTQ